MVSRVEIQNLKRTWEKLRYRRSHKNHKRLRTLLDNCLFGYSCNLLVSPLPFTQKETRNICQKAYHFISWEGKTFVLQGSVMWTLKCSFGSRLFVSAPHASFRSPSAYTVPCKVVVWVFEVIIIIVIIITTKEIHSSCSGNLVWTDSSPFHSRETVHGPWPLLGLDKCFFPFTSPLEENVMIWYIFSHLGNEGLYILPKQWYFFRLSLSWSFKGNWRAISLKEQHRF